MRKLLSFLQRALFQSKSKNEPRVERRRRTKRHQTPSVGAWIYYHHLKIQVTATKSDELWKWLWKHGWRLAAYENDRRQYLILPNDTYAKLDLASTSERPMMIRAFRRKK